MESLFHQFNASLLNKSIHFFKKKKKTDLKQYTKVISLDKTLIFLSAFVSQDLSSGTLSC